MASASFDLERFVHAQQGVYGQARDELAQGRKRTHWMWFVFPQLRGLGHSAMAQRYGLQDLAEARAYLAHPVLGPRLRECAGLLLQVQGRSAREVLGTPDDLKLRSCMTLFACAAPGEAVFAQVLDRFFAGERDALTLALLRGAPAG